MSGRFSCNVLRQELQRNKAVKPRILGFVDNTHTPATELFDDAIMEDGLLEEWLEFRHQALI
jgi:hypothetical protein